MGDGNAEPSYMCNQRGNPRMRWYVLAVTVGRERTVEHKIRDEGLATMLPCDRITVRGVGKGGRVVAYERRVPMLPGYLFVGAGVMPWRVVAGVKGVRGHLNVDGEPAVLSDADVDRVRALYQQTRRRGRFVIGDRVQVARRGLGGIEGVLREIGRSHAVLSVGAFGGLVPVRVPVGDLEHVA